MDEKPPFLISKNSIFKTLLNYFHLQNQYQTQTFKLFKKSIYKTQLLTLFKHSFRLPRNFFGYHKTFPNSTANFSRSVSVLHGGDFFRLRYRCYWLGGDFFLSRLRFILALWRLFRTQRRILRVLQWFSREQLGFFLIWLSVSLLSFRDFPESAVTFTGTTATFTGCQSLLSQRVSNRSSWWLPLC